MIRCPTCSSWTLEAAIHKRLFDLSAVTLHEALGATLIFNSQHHHDTASKVERVNCIIADQSRVPVSAQHIFARGA